MNNDDYLWDGSGTPDPDVQHLETLLVPLRHNRRTPPWPEQNRWLAWLRFEWPFPLHAAVAAMALIAAAGWLALRSPHTSWEVTSLEGRPLVGSGRIGATGRLGVGESVETDAGSRAMINIGQIGEVEVDQNSRVRLVRARVTEHRVALDRGKIHARIWAPARSFFVETPSAVAVDLGCAYTLEVDSSGASLLRTISGWVGFEWKGRESFVPADAACITRVGLGPGTPYFEDASEAFRDALVRLDFERQPQALDTVLAEARARDALTLWHLLAHLDGPDRARVYDRLASLITPPPGATREGVLRGDRKMLDAWWDSLGLGAVSWWRYWKGPYPAR